MDDNEFFIKSIDGQDPKDFFTNFVDNIMNNNKKINKMKKRNNVIEKVCDEIKYVEYCEKENPSEYDVNGEEKKLTEYLNYMEYHLMIARSMRDTRSNVYNINNNEILGEVRKIAALAIKALEIHGCPERVVDSCNGNCKCKKD